MSKYMDSDLLYKLYAFTRTWIHSHYQNSFQVRVDVFPLEIVRMKSMKVLFLSLWCSLFLAYDCAYICLQIENEIYVLQSFWMYSGVQQCIISDLKTCMNGVNPHLFSQLLIYVQKLRSCSTYYMKESRYNKVKSLCHIINSVSQTPHP